MNIGIDCGSLSIKDERLQVGTYQIAVNLLRELSIIDKKNHYLLYSFKPISKEILDYLGKNFENRLLLPEKGWLNFRLSLEFLIRKPDIFFGINQALPLYHPIKSLVIIYDLGFEIYPKYYIGITKRLKYHTKKAIRQAKKLIAISQSTKKDIINLYKIHEDDIKVIYPGVEKIFSPQSNNKIKKIKTKYNLKKPYILFLGSLKSNKNIKGIIESFEALPKKLKENVQLVFAGSNYWTSKDIEQYCEKLVKTKQLIILGYVPKEDMPALYTGAEIFISPSIYEGFGLTILEAMACGCPIITSNQGSIPEVVGDAAIKVNPEDPKEISKALLDLISDKIKREKLKNLGVARAKNYSWSKFAQHILQEINNLNK